MINTATNTVVVTVHTATNTVVATVPVGDLPLELMILLGILSKREIARARIRTRTAMTVQTRD
ncbi:hypothetical protein ACWGI8_32170, partial [Streptomyces sp. NPDC054841]